MLRNEGIIGIEKRLKEKHVAWIMRSQKLHPSEANGMLRSKDDQRNIEKKRYVEKGQNGKRFNGIKWAT